MIAVSDAECSSLGLILGYGYGYGYGYGDAHVYCCVKLSRSSVA